MSVSGVRAGRSTALAVAGAIVALVASAAPAQSIAERAAEVLALRCAECHASTSEKIEGDFGLVDNLPALAKDDIYVVPGDPGGSGLWWVIEDGSMPPDDAKNGPMTREEKMVIRGWIEVGAPTQGLSGPKPTPVTDGVDEAMAVDAPPDAAGADDEEATSPTDAAEPPAADPADPAGPAGPAPTLKDRVRFYGKYHVVAIHYPIALLIVALLAELIRARNAARFCVALGAVGAVAATVLGWMHGWYKTYLGDRADVMTLHQWSGTAVAVLAVLAWALCEWARRGESVGRAWLYRLTLLVAAAGVGITGHWGGQLVHGLDFLPPSIEPFRWLVGILDYLPG